MPKPPLEPARFVGAGLMIHEGMTRREARRAVMAYPEAEFLGGGSFAGAVLVDGRVVKISKPDRGAEASLMVFDAFPDDPNLPRVYSWLQLADGGLAVEMERLWPTLFGEDYGAYTRLGVGEDWAESYRPTAEIAPDTLVGFDLAREQFGRAVAWDCHGGNVMIRADAPWEPVLVDPLYDRERHNGRSGSCLTEDDEYVDFSLDTDDGEAVPMPMPLAA